MFPLRNKLLESWSLNKYRWFSTSLPLLGQNKPNYYGHLELDVTATQNEIKTAYYRLSKMYHPDVNKGSDEAATKFREISAAYEVLGNVRTRKLYDRGLSNAQNIYEAPSYNPSADSTADESVSSFERSRHIKKPSKIYTGRTETYNFDEWTRNHYSSTFSRLQESRERLHTIRTVNERFKSHENSEGLYGYLFLIVVALVVVLGFTIPDAYDNPMLVERQKARRRQEEQSKAGGT